MANRGHKDDDLAYGEYHGGPEDSAASERGLFGDVYHRLKPTTAEPSSQSDESTMSHLFGKIQGSVEQLSSDFKTKLSTFGEGERHSHSHPHGDCSEPFHSSHVGNRFLSFAPPRDGNDSKWYVDACGYMWAVSVALEEAKETIWILDCK
jgi:phospholipase D1/2